MKNVKQLIQLLAIVSGMLVFIDGPQSAEYVPWTDVQQIDLDRPPAMYPPLSGPR